VQIYGFIMSEVFLYIVHWLDNMCVHACAYVSACICTHTVFCRLALYLLVERKGHICGSND